VHSYSMPLHCGITSVIVEKSGCCRYIMSRGIGFSKLVSNISHFTEHINCKMALIITNISNFAVNRDHSNKVRQ